jgi:hypothetical protein
VPTAIVDRDEWEFAFSADRGHRRNKLGFGFIYYRVPSKFLPLLSQEAWERSLGTRGVCRGFSHARFIPGSNAPIPRSSSRLETLQAMLACSTSKVQLPETLRGEHGGGRMCRAGVALPSVPGVRNDARISLGSSEWFRGQARSGWRQGHSFLPLMPDRARRMR